MGPYYVTALVNMIGGVRRVSGSARATFPTRTITSRPKHGEVITVGTPTHISGTLDFANGAIATLVTAGIADLIWLASPHDTFTGAVVLLDVLVMIALAGTVAGSALLIGDRAVPSPRHG